MTLQNFFILTLGIETGLLIIIFTILIYNYFVPRRAIKNYQVNEFSRRYHRAIEEGDEAEIVNLGLEMLEYMNEKEMYRLLNTLG